MANERLRKTITAAGRDYHWLAERVGVDPKTVERWVLQDRVPHRVHRQAAAALLEQDEAFLWPSLLSDPQTHAASEAEVLRMYPTRGAVPLDLWVSLIKGATELTFRTSRGPFGPPLVWGQRFAVRGGSGGVV